MTIFQQSMTISPKSLSLSSTAFARQFKPWLFSFGAEQGVVRGHLGLGVNLSKGGTPRQMSFSSSHLEIRVLRLAEVLFLKKYALIYIVHGLIKNKKDNGTKRHMMKNHSPLPYPSPDPFWLKLVGCLSLHSSIFPNNTHAFLFLDSSTVNITDFLPRGEFPHPSSHYSLAGS